MAAALQEVEQAYQKNFSGIAEFDQRNDRRLRGEQATRRGLVVRQAAYQKAVSSVLDQVRASGNLSNAVRDQIRQSIQNGMQLVDASDLDPDEAYILKYSNQAWIEGMARDLEGNFLFNEWALQKDGDRPVVDYSTYCTFVGAKAVVELLTEVPDGFDLLSEHWTAPEGLNAATAAVEMVRFRSTFIDEEVEEMPAAYVGILFALFPWTFEAVAALLFAYSLAVLIARDTAIQRDDGLPILASPLPSSGAMPMQITKSLDDIRIERAVTEYQTTMDSAVNVARKFDIGEKRFKDLLRERGLLRKPGRPKKELNVA